MFEPVRPEEVPALLAAVAEGRCISCYEPFDGDGHYCPDCDDTTT